MHGGFVCVFNNADKCIVRLNYPETVTFFAFGTTIFGWKNKKRLQTEQASRNQSFHCNEPITMCPVQKNFGEKLLLFEN